MSMFILSLSMQADTAENPVGFLRESMLSVNSSPGAHQAFVDLNRMCLGSGVRRGSALIRGTKPSAPRYRGALFGVCRILCTDYTKHMST